MWSWDDWVMVGVIFVPAVLIIGFLGIEGLVKLTIALTVIGFVLVGVSETYSRALKSRRKR